MFDLFYLHIQDPVILNPNFFPGNLFSTVIILYHARLQVFPCFPLQVEFLWKEEKERVTFFSIWLPTWREHLMPGQAITPSALLGRGGGQGGSVQKPWTHPEGWVSFLRGVDPATWESLCRCHLEEASDFRTGLGCSGGNCGNQAVCDPLYRA